MDGRSPHSAHTDVHTASRPSREHNERPAVPPPHMSTSRDRERDREREYSLAAARYEDERRRHDPYGEDDVVRLSEREREREYLREEARERSAVDYDRRDERYRSAAGGREGYQPAHLDYELHHSPYPSAHLPPHAIASSSRLHHGLAAADSPPVMATNGHRYPTAQDVRAGSLAGLLSPTVHHAADPRYENGDDRANGRVRERERERREEYYDRSHHDPRLSADEPAYAHRHQSSRGGTIQASYANSLEPGATVPQGGLPPPPISASSRSRIPPANGGRPVSPSARDEWERGRFYANGSRHRDTPMQQEDYSNGEMSRERIESWQDGMHASERPPYGEHVFPAQTGSSTPTPAFQTNEERYRAVRLAELRRQHEEANAKILAEAQARYAAAVAEREEREAARRRQRSREKMIRFSELVGEEKERMEYESHLRAEAKRKADAQLAIQEIEETAAKRLALIQEEERKLEERERREQVARMESMAHVEQPPVYAPVGVSSEWESVEPPKRPDGRANRVPPPIVGIRHYRRPPPPPPQPPRNPASNGQWSDPSTSRADIQQEDVAPAAPSPVASAGSPSPTNAEVDELGEAVPKTEENGHREPVEEPPAQSRQATPEPVVVPAPTPKQTKPAKVPYVLPDEEWPTKGLRNKDGSYRKKPGPPKGVKKAPPKNRNPEEQVRRKALLHNMPGGAVDSELLEAASEGESSAAESSKHTSKRRKLQHAAAELDISTSDDEARSARVGEDLPHDDMMSASAPSPRSARAYDDVDNELDELIDEKPRRHRDRAAKDFLEEEDDIPLDDELVEAADPRVDNDARSPQKQNERSGKQQPHAQGDGARRGITDPRGASALDFGESPDFGGIQGAFEDQREQEALRRSPSMESILSEVGHDISMGTAIRRHDQVEYMQHVIWQDIAKFQIPKVQRYVVAAVNNRQSNARRIADAAAKTQRRFAARPGRTTKEMQIRARRAAKEAQLYWKKNEKDELELRKKAEREAIEQAKAVEAAREKRRAERKLNFLLSSGELYSHFMQKKIKTNEAADAPASAPTLHLPDVEDAAALDHENIGDIDFDDDDDEKHHALLRQHAAARAKAVMTENLNKAADFDEQVSAERAQAEMAGEMNSEAPDELDFQNPLAGEDQEAISQPKMLMAQLKEYQLKGLSWLGNLYEQGINGILADEMGLGKVIPGCDVPMPIIGNADQIAMLQTIQSISLLAYLAEKHNIWGPFLVVAPASTVHNWQQELTRFVPKLKALPYWGQPNDRKVLRKDWNRKSIIFTEDAPFHIVVTSYDMAVLDASYFSKVRWQYMILDEAQAVKNSQSLRWNTLLSLKCRNRLLLTGTPIQNSMQELWALLHFIMPQLFDSHEDFSEWFSKGIEGAAGGRDNNLSSHQLKRLHEVLRPFMLRRVKKNVQSELGEKIEVDLMVELSPRQKVLYRALRSSASIRALLSQAADMQDTTKVNSLMNVVMQFRKVCNHPYLFERADVTSPFSFGQFSSSGNLLRQDGLYCPESTKNPISLQVPKLLWNEGGVFNKPAENSRAGFDTKYLQNLLSIWSVEHVAESMKEETSEFAFCRLLDESPSHLTKLAHENTIGKLLQAAKETKNELERAPYLSEITSRPRSSRLGPILPRTALQPFAPNGLSRLDNIAQTHWDQSWLRHSDARFYIEAAVAPPIAAICSSRSFLDTQRLARSDPKADLALHGLPDSMRDDPKAVELVDDFVPGAPADGLFRVTPPDQAPSPAMRFPDMKRLIFDSAKLARLDSLLRELKAGGHRVLIYFQMTRMMSIMEEYLIYRQYKYLRLDGASVIADRRDMVNAWQTNPEIFVFLLSTKAGGLGINLTAADTVIFYDHDWNPSNDSQAMDRAHRLGQTKQVTVYRLIARGTVDERILHLARGKKDVQDIVVGNKSLADISSQKEIVSLLLDDEDIAAGGPADGYVPTTKFGDGLGGLDVDEDDFFGVTAKKNKLAEGDEVDGVDGEGDGKKKKAKPSKPRATKLKDGKGKGKRSAADTQSIADDGSPQPSPKKPRVSKPKGPLKKSKLGMMDAPTLSGQITPRATPAPSASAEPTPDPLAAL